MALGEGEFAGELDGTRIYLDGTPLNNADGTANFTGVSWDYRPGTTSQDYIQGMPNVENEITVNRELKSGTPWVQAMNNTQLSAVRLRFSWPELQCQKDNGDVNGTRIEYAIDIATDGGAPTTGYSTRPSRVKPRRAISAHTVLTCLKPRLAGNSVFVA